MTSVNKLVDTKVVIKTLDCQGTVIKEVTKKNQVTKEGVSVLAKLLVDPSAPRPSHVYGRFAESLADANGTTSFITDLSEVTYGDFTANLGEAGVGTLREPLFSTVKFEDNGDIANGILTFFFRLTADSGLNCTFSSTNSQVFYLGMAAAADTNIPSEDLIYSVLSSHDGTDGFEIPEAGQIAIDYQLTFNP